MSVNVQITGVKELDRKFSKLNLKVQTKLVRAAITAGGRVIVKEIKKQIPSTWKDGRKAIGFRLSKGKGQHQGKTYAKAGVGVGLKKQKKSVGGGRAGRPGVGIGASNLHWFIMGTAERMTGHKRIGGHKKGRVNPLRATGRAIRRTGRMKPDGIVKRAAASAQSAAAMAMRTNMVNGILREWAKS